MRVWGSEIVFAVLLCGTLSSTAQPHHNHRRFSQTTTTTTVCPVHSLLDFVLGFPDSTCPLPDSLGSIAVTEVILPLLMYYCKFSITVFVSSYWSFALLMTREMRFLCRRRWIWFTRIITSMWLCSSMRRGALSRACLDRFSPCSLHCTLPFLIFLLKNPRLGRGLCNAFLPSFFFFLLFVYSFNWMPMRFLQHTVQIWCPWFPYTVHFEFYHAGSVSWFSDTCFAHWFLQWCYRWGTLFFYHSLSTHWDLCAVF